MPPSFLSKVQAIEHAVNGEPCKFYPLSVRELFLIKDLLKPMARSFSLLFSRNDGDRGSYSHSEFDPLDPRPAAKQTAKVFERSETSVSVEVAKFRSEERASAAASIVDTLTNRENGKAVARIIMDSLRDEYPKRPIEDKDAAAFYEQLDLVTLRDLLIGVGKANADVLGPFRGKVESVLRESASPQNGVLEPEMAG